MTRPVNKLNVIVARLVKIHAFERAVDRQNFLAFVICCHRKIFRLSFSETNHACGRHMNIKRR